MTYVVLQGKDSLQVATDRLLVPAAETRAFDTAIECAAALSALLESEQARMDTAYRQASEDGHTEGYDAGYQAAQEEFAQAVVRLAQDRQAQAEAARAAINSLALAMVRKIASLLGPDQLVPALLDQALGAVSPETRVKISVNSCAVEAVEDHLDRIGFDAEVDADDSLDEFGCSLENEDVRVMAGLDEQLGLVAKGLGVTDFVAAPAAGPQAEADAELERAA